MRCVVAKSELLFLYPLVLLKLTKKTLNMFKQTTFNIEIVLL